MGTTVEGCSHSSLSNFFVYDPRLRLLWLDGICCAPRFRTTRVHFAAPGFPALRFTALLSGYPFDIPCSLPSGMECFQDNGVKAFLAICFGSLCNLQLCS
jgi:hypothetical protein